MKSIVGGALLAAMCLNAPSARADIFCIAAHYRVESYQNSYVQLDGIRLVDGSTMAAVSLCGTNCDDRVTDRNLSIILTAQAQGVPVQLYFPGYSNCAAVPSQAKPYGVFLLR